MYKNKSVVLNLSNLNAGRLSQNKIECDILSTKLYPFTGT